MQAWMQNGKVIADGKQIVLCDVCPCGCPPFDGRKIVYVDKHAAGAGDGSSWTDAYTSIQDAIDSHPKKEIQIKGYGESDCYPNEITLQDCVYLNGVDDVFICGEGGGSGDGIKGDRETTAKFENINIKDCGAGFNRIRGGIFENCTATNCGTSVGGGFSNCNSGVFNNCSCTECYNGFEHCDNGTFTNCTAVDCYGGFGQLDYATLVNCSATNCHTGFWIISDSIFDSCYSNSNSVFGFFSCNFSTFTNCGASFNGHCGYYSNSGSSFISCTDSDNCTSGEPECSPGNPSYFCDEV